MQAGIAGERRRLPHTLDHCGVVEMAGVEGRDSRVVHSLIIVNGSAKSAPQFTRAMSHGSPGMARRACSAAPGKAAMWIVIPIAARSVWMIRAWSASGGAPVEMYKVQAHQWLCRTCRMRPS